ncbi:MAG: SAM-dependent methyltransferase [Burkholderiaceae bacterium]
MSDAAATGTLYCLPIPLGPEQSPAQCLPAPTLAIAARLDCFVVENARTARAFLKQVPTAHVLQQIEIHELNEHTPADRLQALLAPLRQGRDVGLMSEAGCPGVADPGAELVALAHRHGIRVVPLVGPSSLLLALMASGLDGQHFAFVGYVPAQADERLRRLQALEQRSARQRESILMIETPYRSQALFDSLLACLSPGTRLTVASALTLADESIRTATVADWREAPATLGKVPTVFGLLAVPQDRVGKEGTRTAPHRPVDRRGPLPRRGPR